MSSRVHGPWREAPEVMEERMRDLGGNLLRRFDLLVLIALLILFVWVTSATAGP